eukprot:GHVR01092671.1.p1 GENE.GHVR01092671.1~~GHVR01092671.1.p1  ORF type:complete len:180 (+),score=26.47 GHVR01092671.1:43-540(+)
MDTLFFGTTDRQSCRRRVETPCWDLPNIQLPPSTHDAKLSPSIVTDYLVFEVNTDSGSVNHICHNNFEEGELDFDERYFGCGSNPVGYKQGYSPYHTHEGTHTLGSTHTLTNDRHTWCDAHNRLTHPCNDTHMWGHSAPSSTIGGDSVGSKELRSSRDHQFYPVV